MGNKDKGQRNAATATPAPNLGATPTDKVAADKIAADKVLADKVAADKVAADKVAADKVAADKVAADKVAADKVAADKVAADKAAADKVAADKVPVVKSVKADMASYEKAYPTEKEFFVSTDGQVFLSKNKADAEAHQKFVNAEEKVSIHKVK